MNKLLHCSRQFFLYFDMFPATQFLRYKQSGDFKTATGGCVSVAIITIFVILFFSLGMQTVNQQIIYGSVSYTNQVEPQPITVAFTKGSDFMFAVGIQYLDLGNTTKKYFNITLRQHHYGPLLAGNNFTNVPLVACTPDHFSYNTDILNFYYKFYLNTALCPPLNFDFTVGGRLVSDLYSQFSVYIDYCNKTIDSSCATDAQVQALQNQFGGFTMYTPIISTVVNPGDAVYKQVYVQQRNHYFFTTTSGLWLNGQIQRYQINTDISLLPTTDTVTQFITTIPNLFQTKARPVYNGHYIQIVFNKSGTSTLFERSFNKIDSYFSYVGGLVGTMLMFFFIFSSYSDTSYIISIASELFKFQEKGWSPWKQYNFFYFAATSLKGILSTFSIEPQWQRSNRFMKIAEQMQKQLNISFLLKRINFLDEAISIILTEHQIETLSLNHKISINEAESKRKKSSIPQGALSIVAKEALQKGKNNSQDDKNNLDISLRHHTNNSNLEMISEQNHPQSWASSQKEQKQDIVNNIRQSLNHVMNESREGNEISRRIIHKVSKVFPQSQILFNQKGKLNTQGQFGNNTLQNINNAKKDQLEIQFYEMS